MKFHRSLKRYGATYQHCLSPYILTKKVTELRAIFVANSIIGEVWDLWPHLMTNIGKIANT